MLAAILNAAGEDKLEVRGDVETTGFGPGKVRVEVRASGLCHSDLSIMNGTIPHPGPVVLGHEAAGEVVEVGAGVTRVSPGDHVIINWMPACGVCSACTAGHANLCPSGRSEVPVPRFSYGGRSALGMLGAGTFTEEVVIGEAFAQPVAADVPFEVAALIGCGVTTGVGAAINTAAVRPASSVVVIGAGGVGISALQGARVAGATQIVAVDPVPARREQALRFGATAAVGPDDLPEAVAEFTAGAGFDYAFEVVGRPETLRAAYDATRRGGSVVIVGVGSQQQQMPINLAELVLGEKRILPSVYGGDLVERTYRQVIELWRAGRLDLESMVTHRLPLAEVNDAIELMRTGESLRTVLTMT